MKNLFPAFITIVLITNPGFAATKNASIGAVKEDQFDIFDRPTNAPLLRNQTSGKLSGQASQLMGELSLDATLTKLQELKNDVGREPTFELLWLQSVASRRIQKASLQIQETFANIDGDIAQNNMLLAYASTKQERYLRLNNVATFMTLGTFGVLESSFGSHTELSDIFGLLGAGSSIALPLSALKPLHFHNPRLNPPRTNMLAAIFDEDRHGDGYEPIVWKYLSSVPPQSLSGKTRREMLLNSWRSYRSMKQIKEDTSSKIFKDIIEAPSKDNQLTVEALKTRAQLLLDVRSLIQALYRDLAELDNIID